MEWSNAQELLAVAGTLSQPMQSFDAQGALVFHNVVKFYTEAGYHLYTARIPSTSSPVSALTWGHSDKRLFIATGNQVHIAWVSRKVATLQLLCRLQVQNCIGSELLVPKLPLPSRIKSLITNMYSQTIRVRIKAKYSTLDCNVIDMVAFIFSAAFQIWNRWESLYPDHRHVQLGCTVRWFAMMRRTMSAPVYAIPCTWSTWAV